jgi:hypothetical protein
MDFEPIKHFPSREQELELRLKIVEAKLAAVEDLLRNPISDYLAIYKIKEILKTL